MANRCSKWCAIVIFVCMCWSRATSRGVPTTNKLMSKSQCHELSKLLRQQSVATVRRFLSDHKISATQKTCVGSTCEGGECCRCCSHGRCSTVQEWANDLGITASLSSVKHPATPKKTVSDWTKHSSKYCSNHGSKGYVSLSAAKEACVKTNGCAGVYDGSCDGRGDFNLCSRGAVLEISTANSCVYTRSNTHAINQCTCDNGSPAVGSSCPSDGAESCASCKPDFHMREQHGHNVCVKQDTAPPHGSCDQAHYSAHTAAYVTPDGHTCSAAQVHHTNVKSLPQCLALCTADPNCHFVMWSFNYAGYCYTGDQCPVTQKRNYNLALYRKLPCGGLRGCTCANGVAASSCPSGGAESCASCKHGFHMREQHGHNVCVKQDTAPPAPKWSKRLGVYCSQHRDSGYSSLTAAKSACLKAPTRCGGVYDVYCDGRGRFHLCPKPATLYKSSQHSCIYTTAAEVADKCTCRNGSPAARCPTHGVEACTTCHSGYYLQKKQGGSVCSVKRCVCKNGTPDIGTSCPSNGAVSCTKCKAGFFLDRNRGGQCSVKKCTCQNGTPAAGTSCPTNGLESCFKCDDGYSLDFGLGHSTCSGDVVVVHGRSLRGDA